MIEMNFRIIVLTTKSLFLSFLYKDRQSNVPEMSYLGQPNRLSLPIRKLFKLNGKYSDYKNFMRSFENLVRNDPTLTHIEIFNHLIKCLSDEALGTVRTFQISEENYPKVIASLKKVYDHECVIFFDNV